MARFDLRWPGDDILKGGRDNDDIKGGLDNDTIIGGPGAEVLIGWAGDDMTTVSTASRATTP